ncbi:ABC transporter ATP-binding protein [Streptomyces sp. SJL17-1]|uniref:ABC transporter ATP-binding protein n=1 Tax=Streptomyces sp. SJL17-1 TaxID=2967223 RepID=UPI0029672D03|nr:ABC transporter ATP-binding protein [Streptomyces sp. SJL17-1]
MPPPAPEPLLSVDGLRVSFPRAARADVEAVRGIDFEVSAGEVFALVGESGAGKSLTARALLGMVPRAAAVSGRVLLRGAPVTPADLGRRLARIPQDALSALSPVHRVEDQLALAVRSVQGLGRREAREAARRALADTGLAPEAATAYPHTLSGGMRQRAVIALALVNGPDLVVADEATTALDPERQEHVLTLLRERCAVAGAALLLVSHDLEAVRRHADRVAVLYAGRIVELGPVARVLERPAAPYTRALLASLPTAGLPRRSRLPVLAGAPPVPGTTNEGCAFAPRCPYATALCRREDPGPRTVDGRRVACHHPLGEAA